MRARLLGTFKVAFFSMAFRCSADSKSRSVFVFLVALNGTERFLKISNMCASFYGSLGFYDCNAFNYRLVL